MFLDCYLGTIIEEVADALVKNVKLVDGIWCLDITSEGRPTRIGVHVGDVIVDGTNPAGRWGQYRGAA